MCCICRDQSVNPVKLPCQHIFCYLCLKGITARNNRCALCRELIPSGFIDQPDVINKDEIMKTLRKSRTWFYEARNGGWWMYEHRVAEDLEKAFCANQDKIHVEISGFLYTVDLVNMVQYRDDRPDRKRQIKREGVTEDCIKGVAGIWIKNVRDKEN